MVGFCSKIITTKIATERNTSLVPKFQTPLKMIYPPEDVDAKKELVNIEIKEAIDMFQQCLSLRTNNKKWTGM
ncbi:FYVE zinc finger, partial [Sesbania bispinosa]